MSVNACGTPKRSATASARPGTGSHTAATCTRSCTSSCVRCGSSPRSAIAPVPTTPRRRGASPVMSVPPPPRSRRSGPRPAARRAAAITASTWIARSAESEGSPPLRHALDELLDAEQVIRACLARVRNVRLVPLALGEQPHRLGDVEQAERERARVAADLELGRRGRLGAEVRLHRCQARRRAAPARAASCRPPRRARARPPRALGDLECVARARADRRHAGHRRDQPGDRGQRIDRHVDERAALRREERRGIGGVALPGRRAAEGRGAHRARRADGARGQHLGRMHDLREEHHAGRAHEHEPALGRCVADRARLGDAAGERLLAVDVLAGGERGERHLGVQADRREVEDGVDRGVAQQTPRSPA